MNVLVNLLVNLSIDLYTRSYIYHNMRAKRDSLSQKILDLVGKADEPLETIEIIDSIKGSTRIKVLYRLYQFRGDSMIHGKQVGSGKGAWIWWK